MKIVFSTYVTLAILTLLLASCSALDKGRLPPFDTLSAIPGSTVSRMGTPVKLVGTPLMVGAPLPPTSLVDAATLKTVDLATFRGKILLLSIVPSIDTKVCEAQTHYLGEQGSTLPADILRITISRDTPFAQKRFATEAGLTAITYLSDYRDGSFGRATGLLQEESMLLARAVVVVDRKGIVRYQQIVPELSHLPDMERAFSAARSLLEEQ